MIELLYRALRTPLGIVLHTTDPERLRQRLYAERRKANDPGLDVLSFVPNSKDPNELWIINKDGAGNGRPSESDREPEPK